MPEAFPSGSTPSQALPASSHSRSFNHYSQRLSTPDGAAGTGEPCVAGTEGLHHGVYRPGLGARAVPRKVEGAKTPLAEVETESTAAPPSGLPRMCLWFPAVLSQPCPGMDFVNTSRIYWRVSAGASPPGCGVTPCRQPPPPRGSPFLYLHNKEGGAVRGGFPTPAVY